MTQDLVPDPPRHRPLRRRRASPADHGTAGPDHRPKRQKALASGNRAETLPAGPRRPGPPARNPSEDVAGDADRHQLMDAGRLAPVPGPAPPIRPPGTPTKAPRIPPDRPRRRRVETGPAPEGPRNPIDIQHGQNVLNSSNNQGVRPGGNRGPEKRHTSVSTGPDCKNADPNKFAKTASVVRENPGSPAPAPPSE